MRIPRFVRRAGTRLARFLLRVTGEAALDRVADDALDRLRRAREKEEQDAIRKEAREQFYRELEARTQGTVLGDRPLTIPQIQKALLDAELARTHVVQAPEPSPDQPEVETVAELFEADPPLPNREYEAAVQEQWGDYPVVAAQTRARVRALLAAKRPASEITRAIVGRQTIIE